VVMGRDHLDCGSVASPYRETEAMRDGSDAIGGLAAAECTVEYGERGFLGINTHGGGWGLVTRNTPDK